MKFARIYFVLLFITSIASGQLRERQEWAANWITHPSVALKQYEVVHFRKPFSLASVPGQYRVRISADSRYKLYVNGQFVGLGPARSDLDHWNYDTYDIAKFLSAGQNMIAAVVWNFGEYNPYFLHSHSTGLIVESETDNAINTNSSWSALLSNAYSPVIFQSNDKRLFWQYYVAGVMDSVVASRYPWNWEVGGDAGQWINAKSLERGCGEGVTNPGFRTLVARSIPPLEYQRQRFSTVRSTTTPIPDKFLSGQGALLVPANSRARVLIDNGALATGYPELTLSEGTGAQISVTYAESMWLTEKGRPDIWHKGDRNSIDGQMRGIYDVFVCDGGAHRQFVPLSFRTFRYVQLEITTHDQPLKVEDLSYWFCAYPYRKEASIAASNKLVSAIDEVAFRTGRLCANETYMDCPYYEQLQYIGDTRLQALYWYYNSSDDALTRNAIQEFYWSMSPDGLTMSRYPSDLPQYTPLFSLCWLLMINDHWKFRRDESFERRFIPAMFNVLNWFAEHRNEEGLFGKMPYLDFVDSHYNQSAMLKSSKSKSLSTVSLFYVYTIQQLKVFFLRNGYSEEFARYDSIAADMVEKIRATCVDPASGMVAETSDKNIFTQHANAMAMLTGIYPADRAPEIMRRASHDPNVAACDTYFKFYFFEALEKAGLGGEILSQLGDWKYMLDNHVSTFTEWAVDPRSDCHAWSTHPVYFFYHTIAGIKPSDDGSDLVVIEPNLLGLTSLTAAVPLNNTMIRVSYSLPARKDGEAVIDVPEGKKAKFLWANSITELGPGRHTIKLKQK